MRSPLPSSTGLQGVLNLRPIPIRAENSWRRAFLNSGPLSVLTMDGIVPLRKTQDANMRRASRALHLDDFSMSSPLQTQQRYVIV